MNRKGVSYDVGRVYYFNWRPVFDPAVVHRELEIIRNDLHCNAVRICGLDINRLSVAAKHALNLGLEVWFSPELWDKSQKQTLDYIAKAAKAAERLRQQNPEKLVFTLASEATLFTQSILEGKNVAQRMKNKKNWARIKAGEHSKPLNEFLGRANEAVRRVFQGKVTYASIIWEGVDWKIFDFVGLDHYRVEQIKDLYVEMLKPFFAYGEPVVITEFGYRTYQGASSTPEGMGGDIVDHKSELLHHMPILGRFIRPKIKGVHVRDEMAQARELVDQLNVLDSAGVDGAFVSTFVSPLATYDDNPKFDLDMASYSLVKSYANGQHGATYPDMQWEPKESFRAVADYYAKH
jgi:hypothetical protein